MSHSASSSNSVNIFIYCLCEVILNHMSNIHSVNTLWSYICANHYWQISLLEMMQRSLPSLGSYFSIIRQGFDICLHEHSANVIHSFLCLCKHHYALILEDVKWPLNLFEKIIHCKLVSSDPLRLHFLHLIHVNPFKLDHARRSMQAFSLNVRNVWKPILEGAKGFIIIHDILWHGCTCEDELTMAVKLWHNRVILRLEASKLPQDLY